jgi:hypothetical protein
MNFGIDCQRPGAGKGPPVGEFGNFIDFGSGLTSEDVCE